MAETKYPCVSDATGCFNFNASSNGVPTPAPGDPGAESFNRLCPTTDVLESDAAVSDAGAPGTWTFTYHVWSQLDCTGTELTAPDNNLTCFAESDLASQTYPNQTANETLLPGAMVNTVLCISDDTQKTFDFQACKELPASGPPDGGAVDAFNCGCTRTGTGACGCDFEVSTLPSECSFDSACNIVCAVAGPVCCPCRACPDPDPFRCSDFHPNDCGMWCISIGCASGGPAKRNQTCQTNGRCR
jgi:hypothetical protein